MWRSVLLILAILVAAPGLAQEDDAPAGNPNSAATVDRLSPNAIAADSADLPDLFAVKPAMPVLAPGSLTNDQIKQLMNQAAEHDIENDKRQRNYTYTEREEQHTLDGKGQIKSTETKTIEIMMLYGEQVERLLEKNDKPLSDKDKAKEEEKLQKIIEKRKNETEEQRKKHLQREEKDREHDREFVRDVGDAYTFRLAGMDQFDGRNAYVIDAEPRPGFEPHHKDAKLLSKFRFRIWIDAAEKQWVKLDAQCIDTVSWGLFLARIHKGSRIVIENTRVNEEVWLPKHLDLRVDVRLALLKNFNVNIDLSYREYKKFRTDTKIVGMGEVQEGK